MANIFIKAIDQDDKDWFKAYCESRRPKSSMSREIKSFIAELKKKEKEHDRGND